MRSLFLLSLLLICTGVWCEEESDVIELDASNFDEGVKADLMLVEFYAPWLAKGEPSLCCMYEMAIEPEYASFCSSMQIIYNYI